MSTFEVEDVFTITGRGEVWSGTRTGHLTTGQYLYTDFGVAIRIRGIEMHCTPFRETLEVDRIGILIPGRAKGIIKKGDVLSTESKH